MIRRELDVYVRAAWLAGLPFHQVWARAKTPGERDWAASYYSRCDMQFAALCREMEIES